MMTYAFRITPVVDSNSIPEAGDRDQTFGKQRLKCQKSGQKCNKNQ